MDVNGVAKSDPPKKKRVNAAQRRALTAATIKTFVEQYGRQAQKGVEPNDRRFDKKVARSIKQIKPEVFDKLLREDED